MKFLDSYHINKALSSIFILNSDVINRIEYDLLNRTTQVVFRNFTKLETTSILNKIALIVNLPVWRNNFLNDMVCVDLLSQLKRSEYLDGYRFLLKYTFTSLNLKSRLNLYIKLRRDNKFFSIENIVKSSVWLQREIWDMYGIIFQGSTDLRRILTDYGFNSFPLRVDFPVLGYIELYYDIEMSELLYKKIDTAQENRFFGYNENLFWF
jgi:NADH:ubiquinone oxidoreductase subunit C